MLLGGSLGSDAYEWAGIFRIPTGTKALTWKMQKVGTWFSTTYAKQSMKMVILPTTNCTEANLHALEATGYPTHKISAKADCTSTKNGDTMVPDFGKACFDLHVDHTVGTSKFKIDVTSVSCIAVFTEHDPEEFKANGHYLDTERVVDEL